MRKLFVPLLIVCGSLATYFATSPRSETPTQPEKAGAQQVQAAASPTTVAELPRESRALYSAPANVIGEKLPAALWRQASTAAPQSLTGRQGQLEATLPRQIASIREGETLSLPLFDGRTARGVVNLTAQEAGGWYRVAGELEAPFSGSFTLSTDGTKTAGLLQFPTRNLAYQIAGDAGNPPVLRERPLSDVVCLPLPRPDFELNAPKQVAKDLPAAAIPLLSSRPTATAVIYLDFDGETVKDPLWNNGNQIVALAYTLSNSQIQQIWQRVKEDFWPFNLDITTDLTRYNNAPVGKRMRCIITPTDTASPGAGGVAYLDSFAQAGTGNFTRTIPCWVFNSSVVGISEAISHEVGHTFGLNHDGRSSPAEEYYGGQGTGATSWAPIMGVGYNKSLVQWSKGEYLNANNKEDDLATISGTANGFGYVTDEAGETIATAASLKVTNNAVNQPGIITKSTDVDVYVFTTGGGAVTLTANPAPLSPNLDIVFDLLDSNGAVVSTDNPTDSLPASISTGLTPGVYYVRIKGTGKGDPRSTGYSSYASIGEYTITGTVPGVPSVPVITSSTSATGETGIDFSYQITASGSPTSYSLSGTLPNGLSFDSGTGILAGIPTQIGTFNLTMGATNGLGSDSKALTLVITAQQSPVISSATSASGVINQTFSYQIVASSRPTSYSVQGTLPNGVTVDTNGLISGLPTLTGVFPVVIKATNAVGTGTANLTITIVAGPPPVITSATFATGKVGKAFLYQTTATENPTSFSISGAVPANLSFATNTGRLVGVPTETGLFTVTITAKNAYGMTSIDLSIDIETNVVTLTSALDQPDLTWTTSGDGTWFPQVDITHDGTDAVMISGLTDRQSATLSTQVEGPGSFRFFWRVSSEKDYDSLVFSVDGVENFRINGSVDWKVTSVPIPSGSHVLSFTYRKDAFQSGGDDSAWVDEVSFFPREGHPGSDSFAGAQALTGAHVSLQSTNADATLEANEPKPFGPTTDHSLWWTWTAPETGFVSVSTEGSSFDTVLAVYVGNSLLDLGLMAANDDISRKDRASAVRFRADAGVTYFISVAGLDAGSGTVALTLDYIAKAEYAGIVVPSKNADALRGYLSIRLGGDLLYTGTLSLQGFRYAVKGELKSGTSTPTVTGTKGAPPVTITVSTDLANGDSTLSGEIDASGEKYAFTARRRVLKTELSNLASGGYTTLLEPKTLGSSVAYGTGYGRILVSSSGSIRLIGALGDGQTVSTGGLVTFGNFWPCYIAPYRKKLGVVAGDVAFDAAAASSFKGSLHWGVIDGANSFTDSVSLVGSYYFKPSIGTPLLLLNSTSQNVQFTLTHRDTVGMPTTQVFTLNAKNQFVDLPATYQFRFSTATGLFSGYLPSPGTGERRAFAGVVVQSDEENRGGGFFLTGNGTGRLDLTVTK